MNALLQLPVHSGARCGANENLQKLDAPPAAAHPRPPVRRRQAFQAEGNLHRWI